MYEALFEMATSQTAHIIDEKVKREKLTKENEALKDSIEKGSYSKAEIDSIAREIDNVEKQLANELNEVSRLRGCLEEHEGTIRNLREEAVEQKKENKRLKVELELLRGDNRSQVDKLSREKDREIDELKKENQALNARLRSAEASLQGCEEERKSLQEAASSKVDSDELKKQLDENDKKVSNLQKANDKLLAENNAQKEVINQLDEKNKAQDGDIEKIRTMEGTIEELKRQNQGYKDEVKDNAEEITELRNELNRHKDAAKEREERKKRVAELEQYNRDEMELKIKTLKDRIAQLEHLEQQTKERDDQINRLNTDIGRYQRSAEDCQGEKAEQLKIIADLNGLNSESLKMLSDCKDERARQEEQISSLKTKNSQNFQEYEAEKAKLTAQVESLKDEKNKWFAASQESETEVTRLAGIVEVDAVPSKPKETISSSLDELSGHLVCKLNGLVRDRETANGHIICANSA